MFSSFLIPQMKMLGLETKITIIIINESFCVTIRDPLFPYLFILCLNHLSLILDQSLHTKQLYWGDKYIWKCP